MLLSRSPRQIGLGGVAIAFPSTVTAVRRAVGRRVSIPTGWASQRQIDAEWPGFGAALDGAGAELRPAYDRYVRDVSAKEHAMSLELAAFLLELCRRVDARRVIDLGSGFSSYVLRVHTAGRPGTHVTSVDSSADWLERSHAFVRDQGVDSGDFLTWGDFDPSADIDSYDVVLHDLGDMTLRTAALPQVLVLAKAGAYVLLDDVHKGGYRAYAHRVVRASSAWSIDVRALTRDSNGRYALLIRRY
jgi:predicted O-methyltransferase YrrM